MTNRDRDGQEAAIVIKKYANRRLYDTGSSAYITLEHLRRMVSEGRDFVVQDAKTGEDITRAVLTQIIVEEEGKSGQSLLPVNFLRQLIAFYDDSAKRVFLPEYLDMMINSFAGSQERIRAVMQENLDKMFSLGGLGAASQQNLAVMEQAMRAFMPFAGLGNAGKPRPTPDADSVPPAGEALAEMQRQLADLRQQLLKMQSSGGKPDPRKDGASGA